MRPSGAARALGFAKNAALEGAVADAPGDMGRWSVLADWLQAQADPRGVVLALALRARDEREALRRAELNAELARLRRPLEEALLAGPAPQQLGAQLSWFGPYVTGLVAGPAFGAEPVEEAVRRVLDAPGGALVRVLALAGCTRAPAEVVSLLASRGQRALRELSLSGVAGPVASLAPVFEGARRLTKLKLQDVDLAPPAVLPGALRELELTTVRPQAQWVDRLAHSGAGVSRLGLAYLEWPALERILFEGPRRALRELSLLGAEATPFVRGLEGASLLAQLEVLVLHGRLSEPALEVLVEAQARMPQLRSLQLVSSELSPGALRRARGLLPLPSFGPRAG